jgi:hypothetical protein
MRKPLVFPGMVLGIVLACEAPAQDSFPRGTIRYDRPQEYAEVSEQTRLPDDLAQQIKAQFEPNPNDLRKIARMYQWVRSNFVTYEGKGGLVGKLSARDLIRSKRLSGCNDWGIVLTCLLRYAGFPVVFLNTAGIESAKALRADGSREHVGHVFLEVFVAGRWIVLDSRTGEYILDYDHNNPVIPIPKKREGETAFFVLQKGRDLWDLGIRDIRQTSALISDFARTYPLDGIQIPHADITRLGINQNSPDHAHPPPEPR